MKVIQDLRRIFRLTPKGRSRTSREPDEAEILEIHRQRDPQANADTSPPADEYIDLYCTWGVEIYTPNSIEELKANFRKLGWRAEESPFPDRDPGVWLHDLRRLQEGGGWISLGYLVPSGQAPPFHNMERHVVPLPAGVEYAMAKMVSISPSLVAVVVCFVFDDATSRLYDGALRESRQTYVIPVGRAFRVHTPPTQKAAHVHQIRNRFSRLIADWFAENLPGVFSNGLLDHELPTYEFVAIRKAEPFPSQEDGGSKFHEYLDILGLLRNFDVWQSATFEGLKLRLRDRIARDTAYHSVFAIWEGQLRWQMPDYYTSSDRTSRIAYVNDVVFEMLGVLSILLLLEGYTQRLKKVRDLARFKLGTSQTPAKLLEELGNDVAYSVDVAAVATDLARAPEALEQMVYSLQGFEPCNSSFYGKSTTLAKRIALVIGEQANWIQAADKTTREQLTQYGALFGTAENIRLQNAIKFLTFGIIGLTTLLGFVSFLDPDTRSNLIGALTFLAELWPW